MKIRLAAPLQTDSIVDGEGLRAVIWTQGCPHKCLGCHNPGTHDFNGGFIKNVESLKKEIDELQIEVGITLSGGEPFSQAKACLEIAKHAKNKGLNIWTYTGYTFEELLILGNKDKNIMGLLENTDVLIDGRFILAKKSLSIPFRGSTNQRIIDVPLSLKKKKAILLKKYIEEKEQEPQKIYI